MMNDLLLLLMRASISASLSDREAFINHVTQIIEKKTGQNPDAARMMSDGLAGLMESLNGELLIRQMFRPRQDKKLNQSIDRLTEAIGKLSELLEETTPAESTSKSKKK